MSSIGLRRLAISRTILRNPAIAGFQLSNYASSTSARHQLLIRTITTTPPSPSSESSPTKPLSGEDVSPDLFPSETVTSQASPDQIPQVITSSTASSQTASTPASSIPNNDVPPLDTQVISEPSSTAFSQLLSKFTGKSSSPTTDTEAVTATVTDQISSQAETSSSFSDLLLTPAMSMLNGVHDITGLPWWASIALSTVAIRVALLPFTLLTMKSSATMQVLKPEIQIRREEVMAAAKTGDKMQAASKQKEMQQFMKDAGVAPTKVLIGPLVQFPVFISFFISIRRLATSDPTFVNGGTLWFENLSALDPNYILPVLCGLTLLGMTELGGDSGQTQTKQMKLFMRSIGVLSIPMTYWFPSAVFCYWIPNNIISMTLGGVMRMPKIRKAVGLAVDPSKIRGTKAFREAQVQQNIAELKVNRKLMDQGVAAASYVKNMSKKSKLDKTDIVQPVLLKTKPTKKQRTKKKTEIKH